ncbi:hypothetical protein SynNOUM97013_01941 [Synechococcus sp. NOUM97013]|nr:hypothetical protein SynNOUM97013_01941 [Synechococcus sp. NOUM97013]
MEGQPLSMSTSFSQSAIQAMILLTFWCDLGHRAAEAM